MKLLQKIITFLFLLILLLNYTECIKNKLLSRNKQTANETTDNILDLFDTLNLNDTYLTNHTHDTNLQNNTDIINSNMTDFNYTIIPPYTMNLTENSTTKQILEEMTKEVIDLSRRLNISNRMKTELNLKIQTIQELTKNFTRKFDLYDIRTKYKLDSLTRSLIEQIELGLRSELQSIKSQMRSGEEDLMEDDIIIENYKNILPNPNTVCGNLNNCTSCTVNPKCGWCSNSNQCVEGSKEGPLKGSCPFYNFEKCPESSDCDSYKICKACLSNVACGWCRDLNLNVNICLNKNEAEKGLCSENSFHHIWKKDSQLATCPKVNMGNFLKYVKDNLHPSDEFIPRDSLISDKKLRIKIPDYDTISNTLILLQNLLSKKIKEQITVDRLLRKYEKTKEEIETLNEEMKILDQKMNLNSTIRKEIATQNLNDIHNIIKVHLSHKKNKTENIINEIFKNDTEMFYRELNKSSIEGVNTFNNTNENKNASTTCEIINKQNSTYIVYEISNMTDILDKMIINNKTEILNENITHTNTNSFLKLENSSKLKESSSSGSILINYVLNLLHLG